MVTRKPKPVPTCHYQLRVTLRDLEPKIWRGLLVPDTTTLAQLHRILQIAMGWTNSHMHEFVIAKTRYGVPDREWQDVNPTLNEKHFTLAAVLQNGVKKFNYLYDFGDGWEHEVRVEKSLLAAGLPPSAQCTAGANACPPDDVGGVPGYCDFVAAILDPKHPDHDEMLQWCGGRFDPYNFDIDSVNTELKRVKI
jgi:Plasmid pRiA4b ORF-3-like protein